MANVIVTLSGLTVIHNENRAISKKYTPEWNFRKLLRIVLQELRSRIYLVVTHLFYMTLLIPNILLSLHATKSQRSLGHHKSVSGTPRSMMLNLLQEVLSNLTWLWSAFHLNCQ